MARRERPRHAAPSDLPPELREFNPRQYRTCAETEAAHDQFMARRRAWAWQYGVPVDHLPDYDVGEWPFDPAVDV